MMDVDPQRRRSTGPLRKAISASRGLFVLCLFLGIARSFLENFGLNRFQVVLDDVSRGKISLISVGVYGALLVSACIVAYVDEIPKTKLRQSVYYHFKLESMKKATVVDFSSTRRLGTGALLQRIEAGANAGRAMACDFWLRSLREILPDIMIGFVFIMLMNAKIAFAVICGYIVLFLITNVVLRRLYALKRDSVVDDERINRGISRVIMELISVRILGLGPKELANARKLSVDNTRRSASVVATHEFFFSFFALLMIVVKIGIIVLFALGSISLSVGGLVALLLYLDRTYNPIAILNVIYVQYKLDRVSLSRLDEFLRLPDDPGLVGHGVRCGSPEAICLRGVGMRIDGTTVLEPIDVRLMLGNSLGIAGPSGAGKSTLLRMILGLIRPTNGEVHINGISTRDIELTEFYQHVSYVSQDPPVFDGTIRENLLLKDDTDDTRVLEILKALGLGNFMDARGGNLDSEVGERGTLVSGGERQRLAVARILLDPKPLIILDEATSAMDSLTEEAVISAVREAAQESMLVIVSHKLKTLSLADEILVLESGRVTGRGCFEELVSAPGVFGKLWEKQ
ncbi:ABC transporter ATP-binding protein [Devriesea agamarum]|uniref:ABC transporter ATP-binding protein n=1 Tax=Devriesea agamarum TaxID=472569 RepID=UPI00071E1FF5|nr:ABC transporter ATP-binding protein [Devriesea agamarum]